MADITGAIKKHCNMEGELLVWNDQYHRIEPFHKIRSTPLHRNGSWDLIKAVYNKGNRVTATVKAGEIESVHIFNSSLKMELERNRADKSIRRTAIKTGLGAVVDVMEPNHLAVMEECDIPVN